MENHEEKLVAAQTMANDLIAEISAMINQDNISKENVAKLKYKLEELAEALNSVQTKGADF